MELFHVMSFAGLIRLFFIAFLVLFSLLITVGLVYLYYLIAKKFEKVAFQKGYNSSIHSFAMCFWLGMIGYLYVIALPDLTQQKRMDKMIALLEHNSPEQSNQ